MLIEDAEETLVKPRTHYPAGIQDLPDDSTTPVVRTFLRSNRLYFALVVILTIILTVAVIMYSRRGRELESAQNEVEQLQIEVTSLKREVTSLKRKASELESKIASMRPSNLTGISYVKTDSGILNDDIYFVNESGKDLHDVNVTINLTGVDGVEKRETKFFGLWLNGTQVYARVISGDPQKGTLRGFCDEGRINISWPTS